MDYDPFEKLKTKPAAPANDKKTGEREEYAAFKVTNNRRQARIEIRQCLAAFHTPSYFHLLDIIPDGYHGTELVLVFTFLVVEIKGRNLRPVYDAIKTGHCEYIQDFHPEAFLEPTPQEPVIEWIKVTTKNQYDAAQAKSNE